LKRWQEVVKRSIDITVSALGLVALSWLILLCWLIATIDTRRNGIFSQERIGRNGRPFRIFKIRSMRPIPGIDTVVTRRDDPRITRLGAWLRKWKLDELPQLINVLLGQMSLVGPRPDVKQYADLLQGADRIILSIRPGITGPATLAFRNEEELLVQAGDSERYNQEVIFPAKVKLNRRYIEHYSLNNDLLCLIATLVPNRTFLRDKQEINLTPLADAQPMAIGIK